MSANTFSINGKETPDGQKHVLFYESMMTGFKLMPAARQKDLLDFWQVYVLSLLLSYSNN